VPGGHHRGPGRAPCHRPAEVAALQAARLLGGLELGPQQRKALRRFKGSTQPQVRQLAESASQEGGDREELEAWLEDLREGDPRRQAAALAGLERSPGATGALVEELLRVEDHGGAVPYLRLLSRLRSHLDRRARTSLTREALKRMEQGAGLVRPLLETMWLAAPEELAAALRPRARTLAASGEHGAACRLLEALAERPEHTTVEDLQELAILQLLHSQLDTGLTARLADPALRTLVQLAGDSEVDLVGLLLEDERLTPEHLHYAGFHLVERHGRARRRGAELLQEVARRSRRSKLGEAARGKLESAGLEIAPRR
jgi:hypothetical protein